MGEISAYTPLKELEWNLIISESAYESLSETSISFSINSDRWRKQNIRYRIILTGEQGRFMCASVVFALPRSARRIRKLCGKLAEEDLFSNVTFYVPDRGTLVLARLVDLTEWREDINVLGRACDAIYPIIWHIQQTRRWDDYMTGLLFKDFEGTG